MVNQSLDRLGDSLLRERMNQQDQTNRETARGDRKAELDVQTGFEERRTKAAETQASETTTLRKAFQENQQAQAAVEGLRKKRQEISRLHEGRQISTAEANRLRKKLADSLDMGNKLIKEEHICDDSP